MKTLYLIPARKGSKGIPGKNKKLLGGKPLIFWSVEVAMELTGDKNICISTDDEDIIDMVGAEFDLDVPFIRPTELATDKASTYEVIMHALEHYESRGIAYDTVVLLQPTSPFRTPDDAKGALDEFDPSVDMVVSVKHTESNPYYVMYTENETGYMEKLLASDVTRRQDLPNIYELNGAVYVMNVDSLKKGPMSSFKKIKKFVMPASRSVDLDSPLDWSFAEFLFSMR